jgi:ferredoxin
MHALYTQLTRYDAAAWRRAIDSLSAEIHPIDRTATRIWFAFFPLDLFLALEAAPDPAILAQKLGLMGRWRLADQIDASHRFFYGHRYWPQVKQAIATAEGLPDQLPAAITAIADAATRRARVDRDMLIGITAAGLMTLRQVGPEAFAAAPGRIHLSDRVRAMTPHQVMKRRARDDSQGLLGFTRGLKKQWTVTFDENDPGASFTAIHGQEIATAAQADKRDYRSRDPRCTPGEGPIPVECRAASCGTCWVGVLGGAEKLSATVPRDEGRRMKVFGYAETDGETPLVRLACQAQAFGAVSIVIPPWNGMFGSVAKEKAHEPETVNDDR